MLVVRLHNIQKPFSALFVFVGLMLSTNVCFTVVGPSTMFKGSLARASLLVQANDCFLTVIY